MSPSLQDPGLVDRLSSGVVLILKLNGLKGTDGWIDRRIEALKTTSRFGETSNLQVHPKTSKKTWTKRDYQWDFKFRIKAIAKLDKLDQLYVLL